MRKLPHILFIVADDYGYNDVGYHQNQKTIANPFGKPTTIPAAGVMQTPTIDRLASEGVKLENFYVQPLCSPTRAALMTGRYPQHTGVGPGVVEIDWPYGLPARETLLPQFLQANTTTTSNSSTVPYATHMVGKWHLGACQERYFPTSRGFDSFLGYLSGGQGYYDSLSDRNGTSTSQPQCVSHTHPEEKDVYSSQFFAAEAERLVLTHSSSQPLFLYLAMQSVHNPYDVPPPTIVDINHTFGEVVDYERRVYAGMVTALDKAVERVTGAFKQAGMWDDTVLVFLSDNGGIGPGNNYPLRGMKVLLWEGGIKSVAFVRGTNNPALRPIDPRVVGTENRNLMHASDILPTLVEGVAGLSLEALPHLPLDGVNQWQAISKFRGSSSALSATGGPRQEIMHNVPPVHLAWPVNIGNSTHPVFSTNLCMAGDGHGGGVDPRAGKGCHSFGITGGAIRFGDLKLLVTHNSSASFFPSAPWEDSSPPGISQYPPGGSFPNKTRVFNPKGDTIPQQFNGSYFLFNISADPTETTNIASHAPVLLQMMLTKYNSYMKEVSTVPDRQWRFGFRDTTFDKDPGGCQGTFPGSFYCAYGREFECSVRGQTWEGETLSETQSQSPLACADSCRKTAECLWWVFDSGSAEGRSDPRARAEVCVLKSAKGQLKNCSTCLWGPNECPH